MASLALQIAAVAQQPTGIGLIPGNAAVTGFSGALSPPLIAPGVDPGVQTFINPDGASLRVIDLQHMGGPPLAQFVAAPKPFAVTAAQIGQVFGVTLDNATPPDVYVAASSAYGLPIVAPGPAGIPQHIKTGAANAAFMPNLWGAAAANGGPGSIWKIDGLTGAVSLFANVTDGDRNNSGPALGALAFDAGSGSLFVSDRETGLIQRFGLDGRPRDRYDHGVTGRAAQGLPAVPWTAAPGIDVTSPQFDSGDPATWHYAAPERRIFGLAIFQHRLFYAVADSLQIWSVGLNSDGSLGNDAIIELMVPPAAGPTEISKITFDDEGRMLLAERPAPSGAFDLEAVTVPAIGRVLRYAVVGLAAGDRRIWQAMPDEFAIGFAGDYRNGNGGIEPGYRYDAKGELDHGSCGGFLWASGEQLRKTSDPVIARQLDATGPADVDGLQGMGGWQIRRHEEPPLQSYYVDYDDRFDDAAARGHIGDIAIPRPCTAAGGADFIQYGGTVPSGGELPPGGGTPPHGHRPPGHPRPPGSCPPDQVRRVSTGTCEPSCGPPNVQIGGSCCAPGELTAVPACSNTQIPGCNAGQTAVGPSNFCCNSNQVYTDASGAQACCDGPTVNGKCPPRVPPGHPVCTPGSTDPNCCANGYVSTGSSCCLASQMTSTKICCPAGDIPSGPGKSQCVPLIQIPRGPQCCAAGLVPAAVTGACCPVANVTTGGTCCPTAVDPKDRTKCPVQIQSITKCADGYTKMPDGMCCANRLLSRDGKSCMATPPAALTPPIPPRVATPPRACPDGSVRDKDGDCVTRRSRACPAGTVRDEDGDCVGRRPPGCPPGMFRTVYGNCVYGGPPPGMYGGPGFGRPRFGGPRRFGPRFGPRPMFGRPGMFRR